MKKQARKLNKSILTHGDPQKLLLKYCGRGVKSNAQVPGSCGFQEIVNFEEFIGFSVDRATGMKIPTTWGKIHYAKDGLHIVPTNPRK